MPFSREQAEALARKNPHPVLRNPHDTAASATFGASGPVDAKRHDDRGEAVSAGFSLTIAGQIRGGKNNMVVTRVGLHFPKKEWAKWRDTAVASVRAQLPRGWESIKKPVNVRLDYVTGDRRRRDFPAICDSVWHVLEKAGVCEDDTLLWPAHSTRAYDKAAPRMKITFIP